MLSHVFERKSVDGITSGVDERVRVLESRLDNKGRGVAHLGGRGVVRAGVSTLGFNKGDLGVRSDDLLDKLSEARVNKISDNTKRLGTTTVEGLLNESGHVLLEHSCDLYLTLGVLRENCLGSEKTSFFGRVPVKLNSVVGSETIADQSAEGLEDSNGAGSVVVSTGCSEERREDEVDGILVGTNNNSAIIRSTGIETRNTSNERSLRPGVVEWEDLDTGVDGGNGLDGVEEPLRGVGASGGLVVSGVERGKVLKVDFHVINADVRE